MLLVLIGGGGPVYGVVVALDPWAIRKGGRWTPLLTWQGSGKLLTKTRIAYPLFVSFYPSSHFSQLGWAASHGWRAGLWLVMYFTSQGAMQRLQLSGTVYGAWRSTAGSLMAFRLLEPKIMFNAVDLSERQKSCRT